MSHRWSRREPQELEAWVSQDYTQVLPDQDAAEQCRDESTSLQEEDAGSPSLYSRIDRLIASAISSRCFEWGGLSDSLQFTLPEQEFIIRAFWAILLGQWQIHRYLAYFWHTFLSLKTDTGHEVGQIPRRAVHRWLLYENNIAGLWLGGFHHGQAIPLPDAPVVDHQRHHPVQVEQEPSAGGEGENHAQLVLCVPNAIF